jgi:nucleotide-binding universal stress UspA family protein
LAPLDLSGPVGETVDHAVSVAAALSANLSLLYVQAPGSRQKVKWPDTSPRRLGGDLQICRRVLQGAAAATIARHAAATDSNLILMTSQAYGNWRSLWKTSVTGDVLRLSALPVSIASAINVDRDYRIRSHRILCVVGLDGQDAELIWQAQEIALRTRAELVLLHVVPEVSEGLLAYAADWRIRPLSVPRAERELIELASCLSVAATTLVMSGHPGKRIAQAARERKADLVLISRKHGESAAAYGSHLDSVLPRLHCPLLTVPVDARRPVEETRPTGARSLPVRTAIYALTQRLKNRGSSPERKPEPTTTPFTIAGDRHSSG